MFEGQYTTMGDRSTLHPRVARTQLNANLGKRGHSSVIETPIIAHI